MRLAFSTILVAPLLCGTSSAASLLANSHTRAVDKIMKPVQKASNLLQKHANHRLMRGNNDDADEGEGGSSTVLDSKADGEGANIEKKDMSQDSPKDMSLDDDNDDEEDDQSDEDLDPVTEQKAQAEKSLKEVRLKKTKAKMDLKRFQTISKNFTAKLEAEKQVMANETASPALAQFLMEMRTDMRTYAAPSYEAYLEQKESDLEAQEKKLEAKIAALEKKNTEKEEKPEEKDTKGPVSEVTSRIARLQELVKMKDSEAGRVFAMAFMSVIIMLSVVFAMASPYQRDSKVRNYTWFILDQVVLIFLAVMYFQAFEQFLDYMNFGGYETAASISHALAVLFLAVLTAYLLRNNGVGLAVVCGAGAHVASFTSIHAGATVQNNIWMGFHYSWPSCLVGMVVYCFVIAILGCVMYQIKKVLGVDQDGKFMDRTNDLENDFGAMGFAVIWSMFVRYVLTGHHPTDDDTEFDHTQRQRNMMLVYAVFTIPVSAIMIFFTSKMSSKQQTTFMTRVLTFIASVSAMNVAWAWLYWGEWQFFETLYLGDPLFGRVMWAIIASVVGVVGIYCFTLFPVNAKPVDSEIAATEAVAVLGKGLKVALTALGLVVAWSWELCFDSAVDDLTEGSQHRHLWKMATCLVMFAVVVPVYTFHMFPISSKAAEAIGA